MKLPRVLLALPLILCACHHKDESLALANQILDATASQAQMRQTWDTGLKPSLDRMKAQGLPPETMEKIHTEAMRFFDENFKWEEVKPKVAELYTKNFTEQELREIVNFYNTPTGKKAVEKLPSLLQDAMKDGMAKVQKNMPELQRKIGTMYMEFRKKQATAQAAARAAAGPTPPGGPHTVNRAPPLGSLLNPRGPGPAAGAPPLGGPAPAVTVPSAAPSAVPTAAPSPTATPKPSQPAAPVPLPGAPAT
jgi:hypothetical protein